MFNSEKIFLNWFLWNVIVMIVIVVRPAHAALIAHAASHLIKGFRRAGFDRAQCSHLQNLL